LKEVIVLENEYLAQTRIIHVGFGQVVRVVVKAGIAGGRVFRWEIDFHLR